MKGLIEAYSTMDAMRKIKEDYPVITKLEEIKEKKGLLNTEINTGIDTRSFVLMCSQFAIILGSGIAIGRAIRLVADKMTNKRLKTMLNQVSKDVEGGRTLAASFETRGAEFLPPTFIETIRAGENSGNLVGAFKSAYEHFDKQEKIAKKVRNALIYPIFVLLVAIVVVIVLMVKVVPTFMDIFDSYGAELPGITRLLINISNFFSKWWWLLLVLTVSIVLGLKLYGRSPEGRLKLAQIKLRLPVLGNIYSLTATSEFANNMCTLIGSGLPITQAIRITGRVISNAYIGRKIGEMNERIEVGYTLGDALRESDAMPDILTDMVAVGEETGELEATLDTAASYYDSELDSATQAALTKLEPAVLVLMAGVAGFIVIAVYVAMFDMYGAM